MMVVIVVVTSWLSLSLAHCIGAMRALQMGWRVVVMFVVAVAEVGGAVVSSTTRNSMVRVLWEGLLLAMGGP